MVASPKLCFLTFRNDRKRSRDRSSQDAMFSTKSTLAELAVPTLRLHGNAPVRALHDTFADHPDVHGILIEGIPGDARQVITRSRFFAKCGQPFFKALFLSRTIADYAAWSPQEALTFDADTPLYQAAEVALERDGDQVYDPIVAEFAHGAAQIVYMRDLMRAQADVMRSASRTANETLSRFLKSQEDLLQARKMEAVGTLSAGLAHELNTPLQFVGSNIAFLDKLHAEFRGVAEAHTSPELLKGFLEDWRDEVPGALADIRNGLARMAEIIGAMKSFSGRDGAGFGAVDANATIQSAAILTQGLRNGHIELRADLAPALPKARGKANALVQVWMNVLTNAFQAIETAGGQTAGVVDVRSRPHEGGMIEIRIADNGIGMDKDTASRCFNPFFTTRSPGAGTGQGLAVVHRVVVEEHKGRIHVESRPGLGTAMRFVLPAA